MATHEPRIRPSLFRVFDSKDKHSGAIGRRRQVAGFFEGRATRSYGRCAHRRTAKPETVGRARAKAFGGLPEICGSLHFHGIHEGSDDRSYLATSEGTAVVRPGAVSRLVIQGETRADDGMELMRVETFQAPSPDQLPSDAELTAKVDKISEDLKALRAAPPAEPYAGPALLSGRAAAVFFHEVLGHRLEGHRQKDETEGQTFTKKINQLVLPSFLTVVDDPTLKELNGVKLGGSYD